VRTARIHLPNAPADLLQRKLNATILDRQRAILHAFYITAQAFYLYRAKIPRQNMPFPFRLNFR